MAKIYEFKTGKLLADLPNESEKIEPTQNKSDEPSDFDRAGDLVLSAMNWAMSLSRPFSKVG